jgi:hypothetical protein
VDAVTFERTDRGIVVSSANADGTTPSFIATPDFADDGECRMRINDEEQLLELWQVSRRALETLFFS